MHDSERSLNPAVVLQPPAHGLMIAERIYDLKEMSNDLCVDGCCCPLCGDVDATLLDSSSMITE
jgi:hypothetical protein